MNKEKEYDPLLAYKVHLFKIKREFLARLLPYKIKLAKVKREFYIRLMELRRNRRRKSKK